MPGKWNEIKIKWNVMNWNIFLILQVIIYIIPQEFQITPENKTQRVYKVPDIYDKK